MLEGEFLQGKHRNAPTTIMYGAEHNLIHQLPLSTRQLLSPRPSALSILLASLGCTHSTLLAHHRPPLPNTMNGSPPPDPFTASPDTTPPRALSPSFNHSHPRKPSSLISAASGSPPPTHRASFPDPAKDPKRGSGRLSGPPAKQDFCCDRDREIHRGEEITIIDAFKTNEGGKASYITYVIRLGVSRRPLHTVG